jgi:ribonuclease BN (tRNA processing enzyme)
MLKTMATAVAVLAAQGALAQPAFAAESCPLLRWTTLGTNGGPISYPERAEPSNMLEAGDEVILVDSGDAAAWQLARTGHSLGAVKNVFLSHLHLDHSGGLAAVVGLRWMNEYPGTITVYGPPGTKELVDGIVASMAMPARIGFGLGIPPSNPESRIKSVEMSDGQVVTIGDLKVKAVANNHHDGPGGLAKKAGALAFSFRFDLGERSVTYTGDTGPDQKVTDLAKGSDLLVSEVIEVEQMITQIAVDRPELNEMMLNGARSHFTKHHLTADEVGKMASTAAVHRVVLTHYVIPKDLAHSAQPLYRDVSAAFSGPVELSRDLSSYDVGCPAK